MNEQPANTSDEDAPETAEVAAATPPAEEAEPSAEELVADAVTDALVTEAVADAAIEAALEETVAEAVLDAAAVEETSDADIQEQFEARVEEAVEEGLEGEELVAAIDEAAEDADAQETIADAVIEAALEETIEEAVADAEAIEAVSDAVIADELVDDLESIAETVEAAEVSEGAPEAAPELAAPAAELTEAPAAPAAEEEPETIVRDPFRGPGDWYVVHTYAGYENKVKTNLESRIHTMQMEDKIFDVHIPMEDVMEIKGGKKQVVQRKVFPGYLLVKMVYDNDSWYVVRNTPGVTGFVAAGTGSKPTPLSKREVEKILAVKKEEVKPQFRLGFEEQDVVRIISGPFADFNGTISEINLDQSKLKVLVNIFDRETPVELSFDQVAKV